jgi:hypothetical protein
MPQQGMLMAAQRLQQSLCPLYITIYLFAALDFWRRELVVLEQTIGEGTVARIGVLVERERLTLALQMLEVSPVARLFEELLDQIRPLAA